MPHANQVVALGKIPVDVVFAAQLFDRLCYKNAPSFTGTSSDINAYGGFLQHAQTGTYFHTKYNLSVKITRSGAGSICSMVMETEQKNVHPTAALSWFVNKHEMSNKLLISEESGVLLHRNVAKSVRFDTNVNGLSRYWMVK